MNDLFSGIEDILERQLPIFSGFNSNLSNYASVINKAKSRYLYCLSRKNIKHKPTSIFLHADEYVSFLCFLANQAWQDGIVEFAESVYILNRRLNHFDCFYTREIPDIFHLEHPVGSVIGQGTFGDYLVVYQGVTVGGDLKLRYPKFGTGVALFSKASVIGPTIVGDNCAIGAGVQLFGECINNDTSISLRNSTGLHMSSLSWSIRERFFLP